MDTQLDKNLWCWEIRSTDATTNNHNQLFILLRACEIIQVVDTVSLSAFLLSLNL
jgi:hypothetical protein